MAESTSPFELPEEKSFFLLRAKEEQHKRKEKRRQLVLPAHQKTSFLGPMKAKQGWERRRPPKLQEEEEGSMKLAMLKQENIKKESRQEFSDKRLEMVLQEYSLIKKKAEIQQLKQNIKRGEERMNLAEQLLDKDWLLFEKFLKENNQNSAEAIQIAERETKRKLEKMAEIKELQTEMVKIKRDIARKEELLQEYRQYKDFLFSMSPAEWREAQLTKTRQAKARAPPGDTPGDTDTAATAAAQDPAKDPLTMTGGPKSGSSGKKVSGCKLPPIREPRLSSNQSVKSSSSSAKQRAASNPSSDDSEYEEEPELYFTTPQQLLDLLWELEEQNLTLIQNSGETEESLEELHRTMDHNKKEMDAATNQLTSQIAAMSQTIAMETERAAALELKARLYNFGKSESANEDHMLEALGHKVQEVYRCCLGEPMANLSTLQMLAEIESQLLQLLQSMEMIPRDTLHQVEKMKERERRIRLQEEKLQQQKQQQEERLRKAMDRAHADIKKTIGRRLMTRSKPVVRKIKSSSVKEVSEQEELHAHFFT